MLAPGRSLPATAVARRAAFVKSRSTSCSARPFAVASFNPLAVVSPRKWTQEERLTLAMQRMLSSSSGATPGTVAGAKAAASAAASGKTPPSRSGGIVGSSSSSKTSGSGSGQEGGGGSSGGGLGSSVTRLVLLAAVLVGMDMAIYAKVPIAKELVDNQLTGPLPPEIYDIYRRCGVDVAYPPGKGRPQREAWDIDVVGKMKKQASRLASAIKGNKSGKDGDIDTSTLTKKQFSLSSPDSKDNAKTKAEKKSDESQHDDKVEHASTPHKTPRLYRRATHVVGQEQCDQEETEKAGTAAAATATAVAAAVKEMVAAAEKNQKKDSSPPPPPAATPPSGKRKPGEGDWMSGNIGEAGSYGAGADARISKSASKGKKDSARKRTKGEKTGAGAVLEGGTDGGGVSSALDGAGKAAKKAKSAAASAIPEPVKDAADSVGTSIAAGDDHADSASSMADDAAAAASDAAETAKDSTKDAAASAKETAISAKDGAKDAAVSVEDTATDAVDAAKDTVMDAAAAAKDTAMNAAAAAKDTATAAKDAAVDAATAAKDAIVDALPSEERSSEAESAGIEVGAEAVDSTVEVIESADGESKTEEELREDAIVDELVRKKRRIRNEALSDIAEEMEVASSGLKRELEQSMLKDLKDLDEDALRFRVAQLATEIQEKAKWEGLRLMKGVSQKEAEFAQKYDKLLAQQKELYESEKIKALRDQEAELTASAMQKYSDELRERMDQQAIDFRQALHDRAMAGYEALRREMEGKYNEEMAAIREEELKREDEAVDDLKKLTYRTESTLESVEAARKAEEAVNAESEKVHRITHATLALAEQFTSSAPIEPALENLRRLARGDELFDAAAGSIPKKAAAKGIPTVAQLKQRFGIVKTECRRAAFVPEEAGDGLLGHILASVVAKITFAPKGMVEGNSAEDLLARADHLLEAGELRSAIHELDQLKGLPATVVMDWLEDAKTRLTADDALRVIRCHASLLNVKHLRGLEKE